MFEINDFSAQQTNIDLLQTEALVGHHRHLRVSFHLTPFFVSSEDANWERTTVSDFFSFFPLGSVRTGWETHSFHRESYRQRPTRTASIDVLAQLLLLGRDCKRLRDLVCSPIKPHAVLLHFFFLPPLLLQRDHLDRLRHQTSLLFIAIWASFCVRASSPLSSLRLLLFFFFVLFNRCQKKKKKKLSLSLSSLLLFLLTSRLLVLPFLLPNSYVSHWLLREIIPVQKKVL